MQIGCPIKQKESQNIAFPSYDYLKTFSSNRFYIVIIGAYIIIAMKTK